MKTLWKRDKHKGLNESQKEWKTLFEEIFFSEEEIEMGLTYPLEFSYIIMDEEIKDLDGWYFPFVQKYNIVSAMPLCTIEILLDENDGHLVVKDAINDSYRTYHIYLLTHKGEKMTSYLLSREKKEEMMELFNITPKMMIEMLTEDKNGYLIHIQ